MDSRSPIPPQQKNFPPPAAPRDHSIPRSLGAFVGHLLKAIKTPVTPTKATVRKEVQERTIHTDQGPLTLRRTVIDEVQRPAPKSP